MNLDDLRENLGSYYLGMNPGYRYVPYQQERIVPALEAVERGKISRLMIWIPPGHAKSDLATRYLSTWFMGRSPKKNVIILSYSSKLATNKFGRDVKKILEHKLYAELFPNSVPTKDSRAKDNIVNVSGGEFYAMGLDASVLGNRADLIVMDDLISSDEDADSDAYMERTMNNYWSVVKSRLRPNSAIVFCNHRWRIRDVCGQILEQEGNVEDGGDWTVLKIPAEDADGKFLWEEYYGKKHYEDAKGHEDSWYSMWQQEPAASSSLWFNQEWINYYDIPIAPGKFNTYIFVDPAAAKGKKSDRTSIFVIAAGQDQKLFWVDGVLDRLDPGERAATIMRMLRRWNPEQLVYEEYGLVNDTYYLRQQLEKEAWNGAYPVAVGKSGPRHNLSKAQRIKGLVPLFREGRFFFPRKMERTTVDGKKVDLVQWFLQNEFSLYKGDGSIAHEDMLDCLSRILEPEVVIEYAAVSEERESHPRYRTHGSWESLYILLITFFGLAMLWV